MLIANERPRRQRRKGQSSPKIEESQSSLLITSAAASSQRICPFVRPALMAETLRRDVGRAFSRHTSYLPSIEDIGLLRTCQQIVELTLDSVVTWHSVPLLYNGFNPSDVIERLAYSCCAELRKRLDRSRAGLGRRRPWAVRAGGAVQLDGPGARHHRHHSIPCRQRTSIPGRRSPAAWT